MGVTEPLTLIDFKGSSSLSGWAVVDDVVMGGRSDSRIVIHDSGYAIFEGEVSLENNGGFSSVRYRMEPILAEGYSKAVIRLKGDGKKYQFRLRADRADAHTYTRSFETTGRWETIEIPLNEMTPTWRGMKLRISNYSGGKLSEVGILIGNKKAEKFRLELESIKLEK